MHEGIYAESKHCWRVQLAITLKLICENENSIEIKKNVFLNVVICVTIYIVSLPSAKYQPDCVRTAKKYLGTSLLWYDAFGCLD